MGALRKLVVHAYAVAFAAQRFIYLCTGDLNNITASSSADLARSHARGAFKLHFSVGAFFFVCDVAFTEAQLLPAALCEVLHLRLGRRLRDLVGLERTRGVTFLQPRFEFVNAHLGDRADLPV